MERFAKVVNGFRKTLHLRCLAAFSIRLSKTAFTCSKLTIETLEQGVKYVQS